jgi:hypothetical protein
MGRAVGIVVSIVLLVGCGSIPTASAPPEANQASPTSTANQTSAAGHGSAAASPTAAPALFPHEAATQTGPYAILVDLLSLPDRYAISVVAKDASVVAAQKAAKRSPVANSGGHGLELPYLSTTSTALYYLDGDSTVRALLVNGMTSDPKPITQLDVSAGMEAAFSVSPDNKTIAVSVLDFNRTPVHLRLYTDKAVGGARRVIYESDTNYVWPVAWHGGLLVLAHAYGPYLEDVSKAAPGRDNPYWAISYHVVDPATAIRVTLLGSCTVSGPLTPVGSACIQGGSIDWRGTTTSWGTRNWGSISSAASISPDGGFIAAARPDDEGFVGFWRPDGTLSTYVSGPGARDWAGWLDATHVLIASAVSVDFQPRIVPITPGPSLARFIAARGFYAALLPTDIS